MFVNSFNYLKSHLYCFKLYLNSSLFDVNNLDFDRPHLKTDYDVSIKYSIEEIDIDLSSRNVYII